MNLRAAMPATTELIDACREAFGADAINASIRKGLAGIPGYFHAVENGREVGTEAAPETNSISATDMVLGPFIPTQTESHADRNHRR